VGTTDVVTDQRLATPSVLGPGLLLGVGLGAFVDGIVLHQLLAWHHMLSARTLDMRANEIGDGLFHAAAWVAVLVALLWLWRRSLPPARPWPALIGPLLAGWGLFNLVEGLVNHQILGLHHVRAGPHRLAYDLAFLAFGAVLVAVGALLYRRGRG
jgi:uncharacterized membrane protein